MEFPAGELNEKTLSSALWKAAKLGSLVSRKLGHAAVRERMCRSNPVSSRYIVLGGYSEPSFLRVSAT